MAWLGGVEVMLAYASCCWVLVDAAEVVLVTAVVMLCDAEVLLGEAGLCWVPMR